MNAPWALLVLLASGCAGVGGGELELEADRLRNAAMKTFEGGNVGSAAEMNGRALALSRGLPATSWRVVENHDDAGLYHFAAGKYEASTRHQAVAVLLACGAESNFEPFPVYVERLGWAFSRYRPGFDMAPVMANPLVLLDDAALDVRSVADLRRRYYERVRVNSIARSDTPRHRTRLRRDAPVACPDARAAR